MFAIIADFLTKKITSINLPKHLNSIHWYEQKIDQSYYSDPE